MRGEARVQARGKVWRGRVWGRCRLWARAVPAAAARLRHQFLLRFFDLALDLGTLRAQRGERRERAEVAGAVGRVGLQRRPHFLEGLGDGGDAFRQRRVRHDRRRAQLSVEHLVDAEDGGGAAEDGRLLVAREHERLKRWGGKAGCERACVVVGRST